VRFESLRLIAFGPFCDRPLELAPGMNVIFGPNEAGKSALHAAAYAGLCGTRRGRGLSREEKAFRDQHRPWEGSEWTVGAVIVLADGRRIELHHDLDGKVRSRAIDLELGTDVSGEIVFEGGIDGSRWLGLDRRTFLATACVRQADVLGVTEHPELLAEHLQRAAASAGGDATAAAALELIDRCLREQVGQDRASSTRPLRKAIEAREEAERHLEAARRAHAEYRQAVARVEELERAELAARTELMVWEAAAARRRAEEAGRRLARAEEILARVPERPEMDLAAGEHLARRAQAVLKRWLERPEVPTLTGPSAEEMEAELATLPEAPEGDLDPDPAVIAARDGWIAARGALAAHGRDRPPEPVPPPTEHPELVLRDLARELGGPEPEPDPELLARRAEASRRVEASQGSPFELALIAALLAVLVAGLAGAVLVRPALVLAALLVDVVLGSVVWLRHLQERNAALTALNQADAALGGAGLAARRRQQAAERAAALGLPADPERLLALADEAGLASAARARKESWERRAVELDHQLRRAEHELWTALAGRGQGWLGSVEASLDAYLRGCQERKARAELAARRRTLEAQLAMRRTLEARIAEELASRRRAVEELASVAAEIGLRAEGEEALAVAVEDWLDRRLEAVGEHQRRLQEWGELETLLAGATVDQLRAEAGRRQAEAQRLETAVDGSRLAAVLAQQVDLEAELQLRRRRAAAAAEEVAAARGSLRLLAAQVPDLSAAEEALEEAEAELRRVQELERVLSLTRDFLRRAQDRVHRDVAPVLTRTLRDWLPQVTAGRYTDALVNPSTLEVRVCGPRREWREAHLLSQGTREQIYLLLRLALIERLTRPGESCPLLLDEVTVHSDTGRTEALLDLLHRISGTHQVLLFTQEDRVQEWAQRALRAPQDRLVVLEGAAALT
jgi:exonuclease SbcC